MKTLYEDILQLTEDECHEFLFATIFPKGFVCPHCGSTTFSFIQSRKLYQCTVCKHQFSLKSLSILRKSHLPIQKWLLAIALLCDDGGITAVRASRILGISYKSAWLTLHKIRSVMRLCLRSSQFSFKRLVCLFFTIPGIAHRQRTQKSPVETIETDNTFSLLHIHLTESHRKQHHIQHFGKAFLKKKCTTFESPSSDTISPIVEKARRLLRETYRNGCRKHPQRYLDEFSFRWNVAAGNRFWEVFQNLVLPPLPYKHLVSESLVLPVA